LEVNVHNETEKFQTGTGHEPKQSPMFANVAASIAEEIAAIAEMM
jgi:hypothetical protein